MAQAPNTPQELEEAIAAFKLHGTKLAAARALGLPPPTYRNRLDAAKRAGYEIPQIIPPPSVKGRRLETAFSDGIVIVGSDLHAWPGEPSTAFRAFVKFIKKLKPAIVVLNGDAIDCAAISRHPPIGWTHIPTVKDEIEICQERLGEIVKASGKAKRYWPLGNHDARFETRLATVAPEFRGVPFSSMVDHFPDWEPCWSVQIGGERGVVIKHRFKGGIHATHNNTMWAGRSIVTGHLHALKVTPFSDYNGTRYGVDCGCLADPYAPAFQDYGEDNPRNWRSGFAVLTFRNGRLMMPELVQVVEDGVVEFRSELIEV